MSKLALRKLKKIETKNFQCQIVEMKLIVRVGSHLQILRTLEFASRCRICSMAIKRRMQPF